MNEVQMLSKQKSDVDLPVQFSTQHSFVQAEIKRNDIEYCAHVMSTRMYSPMHILRDFKNRTKDLPRIIAGFHPKYFKVTK